jgi:hypothetical protein
MGSQAMICPMHPTRFRWIGVSAGLLAAFLWPQAAGSVSAQSGQGTYARIAYFKVASGREADFERIMRDEWKPLYRAQQQSRNVADWLLYRVHLTGATDEYNGSGEHLKHALSRMAA